MKHAFALNTALACVLLLPAVTIEPRQGESIPQTLLRTVRALEHLAGLQQTLEQPDAGPSAIATVIEWTEPPMLAAEEREQLLVDLRDEVNRLQGEYDLVAPDAAPDTEPLTEVLADLEGPDEPGVPPAPTTGLDEGMRRLLASIHEPTPHAATAATQPAQHAREPVSFEPEGYTADALRMARVRYRQGRWTETLELLEKAGDAEAVYLRGRTFERLARFTEAQADYRAVMAMPDAGTLVERAREDSEFLEWRQGFTSKLAGVKPRALEGH